MVKPLPDTDIDTQLLLDAYTKLREKLNGKCSINICPIHLIEYKYVLEVPFTDFCDFCTRGWDLLDSFDCPCKSELTPKEIFLRLDEVIYLLQEKLKKEQSN